MIAILKYNAGNITSVKNAVERLGFECIVSDDRAEILHAEKVILPGVGEAGSAMAYLKEKRLDLLIRELKQPVLGICLGQQLLCKYTEEGNTECLGIFDAEVKQFPPVQLVPHMGWNNLTDTRNELFKGILNNEDFYFVHSYYAGLCADTSAICRYIVPFSAAMQKENFYATQFHPEKSARAGEQVLRNFLSL